MMSTTLMDKPAKVSKLVSFTIEIDMQINIDSDLPEDDFMAELLSDKFDMSKSIEVSRRMSSIRVEDVNHYYS